MKLSVLINTFNEGGRVLSTCKSFIDAGADEVVVYADGTTDGSCQNLPPKVKVIHGEKSIGCGKAKVKATNASSGDVLMWVDAHQSVERGDLRSAAEQVLNENLIVCPTLANIYYDESWQPHRVPDSKRDFYPCNSLLLPTGGNQYRLSKEKNNISIGVGLCMSRKTYARVGGWNNFKGRHGSQERGMALRAFMSDVPVSVDEKLCLGHEFFGDKHPSRNVQTGVYRFNNLVHPAYNLWHAYMAVLSQSGFESVVAPWLEGFENLRSGRLALADANAVQDRAYFSRHCKRRPDEDLFELLSKLPKIEFARDTGGASLEPAAVHFLKSFSRGRCLELGTGSGKGTLALLEGASEVLSVDHMPVYSNAAKSKITDLRAAFLSVGIKENGFYDLSSVEGLFDLVVIDGPPGTQARRYSIEECLPFLAHGGCILADDAKRDLEGIMDAVQKFNLKLEMLPTQRGMAKITCQAAS